MSENSNKLKLQFNKKTNDLTCSLPSTEERKWDANYLFMKFLYANKDKLETSFIEELQKRGYDIRTLKFEIEKQSKDDNYVYNNILNFGGYSHLYYLRQFASYCFSLNKKESNENQLIFTRMVHAEESKIIFTKYRYNWNVELVNYSPFSDMIKIIYDFLNLLADNKDKISEILNLKIDEE